MNPTLVFVRHTEIGGRAFAHGSELPPDTLSEQVVGQLIDAGCVKEYKERRSLYRLFASFSWCSERDRLSQEELAAYALPD